MHTERLSLSLTTPSVYVKNLEERIKPADLREGLTEIFSEYGTIIDIVAKTNLKAKGQAFIVFEDVESAAKAIEEVQGFEIFGKEMDLDFARTRSDATVLKEEGDAGLERFKRGRLAEKERKQAVEVQMSKLKRPAATQQVPERPSKAVKGAGLKAAGGNSAAVIPDEYLPPNKILFLRELPLEYDVEGLSRIFSRFEGFREVRMVPGRPGIALSSTRQRQVRSARRRQQRVCNWETRARLSGLLSRGSDAMQEVHKHWRYLIQPMYSDHLQQ